MVQLNPNPNPPLSRGRHTDEVWSVAYSPDGQHIISGSKDITIRTWDAKTGTPVGAPLKGHAQSVWPVAYSPNGQHIISGSYDSTIKIWDAEAHSAAGKPLGEHTHLIGLLHTPLTGSTSFLGLMTILPV